MVDRVCIYCLRTSPCKEMCRVEWTSQSVETVVSVPVKGSITGERVARRWKVLRGDYAGKLVYAGRDSYGCANDDTRFTGVEHMACSENESGTPFFTISKDDIVEVTRLFSGDWGV